MKNSFVVIALLVIASVFLCEVSLAAVKSESGMYIVDDAEGYAPVVNGNKNAAREEAKREAYRDALEKALGAVVTGVTEMENYAVVRDKVFSQTAGIVKDFEILREWVDEDDLLHLTAICRVGTTALDGVLGPAVIDAIGNPRVMVLIDERIADKTPFLSVTEGEVLRIFEKAGYLIVDPDQARTLVKMDPAAAFDSPEMIMEVARTLKADVIILGKAYGNAFQEGTQEGIKMFGVKGTVQLKAVLTKSAYQISSKTVEQSTGKVPALSVEDGAMRCFKQAASVASSEIIHKIAYSLASGSSSGVPGITVNIKIADVTFKQVESITESLREFVGKNSSVYEREYKDGHLEIDVVSEKTARNIASLLSESGFEIDGVTTQTIVAKTIKTVEPEVVQKSEDVPAPEEPKAEEPKKSGGVCGVGANGVLCVAAILSVVFSRRRRIK